MQRRALMQAAGRLVLSSMPIATIALWPTAAPAQTLDLSGAKFPPSVSLAGQSLQLNGAGIRHKFVVKVYAAGLYLAGTAATPEAVMSAPGPKRLQVAMLREIDANELGRLFTRGMQDNASREQFSKLIPGTIRMSDIFSARKRLRAGDSFSVDFVPGVGTTVLVNGQAQAEPIKEPEFFNALMRIWLGPSPADAALKSALLGLPVTAAGGAGPQQ
jgi:hypothetical protein